MRKSFANRDFILSMIDGKPYKALRRHLSVHGLTPDEYRARYGLSFDYPLVAPAYRGERSATAKRLGLGRKPKAAPTGADQAARASSSKQRRDSAPVPKPTKGKKRSG